MSRGGLLLGTSRYWQATNRYPFRAPHWRPERIYNSCVPYSSVAMRPLGARFCTVTDWKSQLDGHLPNETMISRTIRIVIWGMLLSRRHAFVVRGADDAFRDDLRRSIDRLTAMLRRVARTPSVDRRTSQTAPVALKGRSSQYGIDTAGPNTRACPQNVLYA